MGREMCVCMCTSLLEKLFISILLRILAYVLLIIYFSFFALICRLKKKNELTIRFSHQFICLLLYMYREQYFLYITRDRQRQKERVIGRKKFYIETMSILTFGRNYIEVS